VAESAVTEKVTGIPARGLPLSVKFAVTVVDSLDASDDFTSVSVVVTLPPGTGVVMDVVEPPPLPHEPSIAVTMNTAISLISNIYIVPFIVSYKLITNVTNPCL
jgi:hypothetical protein